MPLMNIDAAIRMEVGEMYKIIGCLFCVVLLAGCDQHIARHWGGTMEQKVPCGQKLEGVTWKGQNSELWYLFRPMRQNEVPETHVFKASTTFGVFEGQVNIVESLCK
tara:strand:+ start:834 stop:1154 length:321 start_codon:yes stop_codon:yes gene_type:complete